jgi:phosphate-selective porin OprO/OprP
MSNVASISEILARLAHTTRCNVLPWEHHRAANGGAIVSGKHNLGRYLAVSIVLGMELASASSASADNMEKMEAQLEAMQAQIKQLQRQIEENRAAAAAAQATAAKSAESAAAAQWTAGTIETGSIGKSSEKPSSEKDDLDLKVKWKGAPELSSKDGKFKMKVRGRLNADYDNIDQDEAITGQPDVSAAEIRRARLGVEGVLWKDIAYKFEVDFANDTTAIKDAYFEYIWEKLAFRFGNFKTFNSLEHLTSSNFVTFMERSAFIEAFQLDRQIGTGALWREDHFTLAAGVFGPHPFDEEEWLDDVKTGAARITVAPINNDDTVVHLGASWRYRHGAEDLRDDPIPENDQFFLYRARGADLHLADRFIVTPEIFDQDTFWGLEGAVICGPWSIQGEYGQLNPSIAPEFAGVDPTYSGWYVEASWYITGEMRTYKDGEIGRPKVKNPVNEGGHGAWQLAAKYDVIDLNDNAALIPDCEMCGEQNTWLIGVNWWLNDHTRFIVNYNQSSIEGGFLDGANVNDGATIKGFGTRAQVDW